MSATAGFEAMRARFLPYQVDWLSDRTQRRVAVKSRRVGFSEVAAAECAAALVGFDLVTGDVVRPRPQVIASASQNHSRDLLARVATTLHAFEQVAGPLIADGGEQVFRLQLRNGMTATAVPASASALRGLEGDLLLDEIGAMPHAAEIFAAGKPVTDPNLGNPDGYRVSAIGTPLGDGSFFHDIARGQRSAGWSVHEVSIHTAIAQGFPLRGTLDEFREEIGDSDVFAQEYECVFLSAAGRYISEALFDDAVVQVPEGKQWQDMIPAHSRVAGAGFDVARRGKHKSASCELWADSGGKLWLRELRTERGMPWHAQEAWADEIAGRCSHLAVDASGLGSQFGERLAERHGSTVEPVVFTAPFKEQLFSGLRLALERGMLKLPNSPELRRAVLSLRRRFTDSGNTVFDVADDKHGHGDEAIALALAVHASGGALGALGCSSDRMMWTPERSERSKFLRPRMRAWAQ
jgi:phage FluMu gp28-like protein